MSRKDQSLFEDLTDLASILPCWLSLLLAVLSYSVLHQFADLTPGATANFHEFSELVTKQFLKTLASFLQYIIPFAFSLGALLSLIKTQRRFGFSRALKSFLLAITLFLLAIFLILLWHHAPSPEFANTTIGRRLSDFFPSLQKQALPTVDGTKTDTGKKDYVFSEKEIEIAKKFLEEDRQEKTLFEIQMHSGKTLFAEKVTISGETITFESDTGLVVSMNRQDVKKVRKLIKH